MLLVVCPNLAVDRILQVPNFEATRVQRSSSVILQPGGKGSNAARVFRQLGGKVILAGFVGKQDGSWIASRLRAKGIIVEAVTAYDAASRTCTIVCDPVSGAHPTVINEESPEIEPGSAQRLIARIERWIPRVDAVLTTGSLPRGLQTDFYAQVLDRARARSKVTAIDAAGQVLREGMAAHPFFMKPNWEEFCQFTDGQMLSMLAPHSALTFGEAGAALFYDGTCIYGAPPRIERNNPIGAGDAFAAGYLKSLLDGAKPEDCLRSALAAAACDAATLRPGFIDRDAYDSMLHEIPTLGTSVPL